MAATRSRMNMYTSKKQTYKKALEITEI